jgi:hypothetical protein
MLVDCWLPSSLKSMANCQLTPFNFQRPTHKNAAPTSSICLSSYSPVSLFLAKAPSKDTMKLLTISPLLVQPVLAFIPRPLLSPSLSRDEKLFQTQTSTDESYLKSQRQELVEALARIETLEGDIQNVSITEDLTTKIDLIEVLEKDVDKILTQFIPPVGLSLADFTAAMRLFLQLPPSARLALVKALDLEDAAAGDFQRIPEIVQRLHTERQLLTPKLLSDSMQSALSVTKTKPTDDRPLSGNSAKERVSQFYEKSRDELEIESNVKTLLGRLTKKTEKVPTEADLQILMDTIDNSIFTLNGKPIEIPGGYILSGQNRKSNGDLLIESIDQKLPTDGWNCSVSYMPDITSSSGDFFDERGNILILYNKDFSPSNKWLYNISTVCALTTILLFAFGIFGSNETLLSQLTESTAFGDYSGVDFLNKKVVEFILPLFVILFSHELGHFLISKKEKIQTASLFPTLLPFVNSLPLMGSLTRITSSPRNLTSLYDFAVSGPLFGFLSSFFFVFVGLLATKSAFEGDSNAAELLPALPVSVIKVSTLGGSIVDTFFGGEGFITSQDPKTPVPLHPFFIAGFCGVLINAVEMLPLGANDGGRLSLSLFGRQGHSVLGGLTWFALLVASFALDEHQGELLVTAWIVNNIVQNEQEIPCRDETDNINLTRVVVAFGMWFLAILTLVPMS